MIERAREPCNRMDFHHLDDRNNEGLRHIRLRSPRCKAAHFGAVEIHVCRKTVCVVIEFDTPKTENQDTGVYKQHRHADLRDDALNLACVVKSPPSGSDGHHAEALSLSAARIPSEYASCHAELCIVSLLTRTMRKDEVSDLVPNRLSLPCAAILRPHYAHHITDRCEKIGAIYCVFTILPAVSGLCLPSRNSTRKTGSRFIMAGAHIAWCW